MSEPARRPFGHEPASIAGRPIRLAAAILLAAVLTVAFILHWSLEHGAAPHFAQVAARQGPVPPAPRLQAHPTADLATVRGEQEALLGQYVWLDGAHTVARIPIERAMAIYAHQQGHSP